MKNTFKIAIGDWSGDGHSICDYGNYTCNKSLEEVREAYFKAIKVLGKEYPNIICKEYEDDKVSEDMIIELKEKGFSFTRHFEKVDDEIYPYIDGMLELIEWFILQGDPKIKLKNIDSDIPVFQFYGYDDKGRHIGHLGYGVQHR